MKKPITRRETIIASVKSFIKNYPEEYQTILDSIKEKRAKMGEWSYGEIIGADGKKDDEVRLSLRLPNRMLGAINEILTIHGQDVLFKGRDNEEADREYKWFKETFPMFVVPNYRKRIW